jgi:hypothetical protein
VRKLATMPSEPPPPYVSRSLDDNGEAMSAPPPNPMMASPVASPGRSGNHLIRVETGEM